MSPWQLESFLDVPRNLPVKLYQNRVSSSWDIADIEFLWWSGYVGGVCTVIFLSNPTVVLRLGWGFDNKDLFKTTWTPLDYFKTVWRLDSFFKNTEQTASGLLEDEFEKCLGVLEVYIIGADLLARECGVPVGRRSDGRLAMTLVATINVIIFHFPFFPFFSSFSP